MSLIKEISQNCPNCGNLQNVSYYSSVNVTLDQSLKNPVLNGTLNSNSCSNCSRQINILSDLLYHDMEKAFIIHLRMDPDDELRSNSTMLQPFEEKGYLCLEVDAYPDLVEKIKILDLNLNVAVVERAKAIVLNMLVETFTATIGAVNPTDFTIFFEGYEKKLFKKKLTFMFFLDESQVMRMQIDCNQLSKSDRKLLFNRDAGQ